MTKGKITISYGTPTGWPGYLVGAGYGRDEETTLLANRCGEWLAEHIGQDVTLRCNTDGWSGGAFRDMVATWHPTPLRFGDNSAASLPGSWYGLSAARLLRRDEPIWSQNRRLVFRAFFLFPLTALDDVQAEVPRHDLIVEGILCPKDWADVSSPHFSTLEEAGAWLLEWGGKFCPEIKRALGYLFSPQAGMGGE